jgi:hypothetical protein
MVKQRPIRRVIHLEFAFDRLLAAKLEQAYDILVPDRVRVVGSAKVNYTAFRGSASAPSLAS